MKKMFLVLMLLFSSVVWGELDVDATEIHFGDVDIDGFDERETIWIQNISEETVRITYWSFGDDDFYTDSTCWYELEPNERCFITVIFAPSRMGHFNSRLTIKSGKKEHGVSISGSGVY